MLRILFAAVVALCTAMPVLAGPLQDVLQTHQSAVEKASRKTVDPVIAALLDSGLPEVQGFLENWRERNVWQRKDDKLFFYVETDDKKTYRLIDLDSGDVVAEAAKNELKQLKPNSGVRGVIATALVQFQLLDPDPARRVEALEAVQRDPEASHLAPCAGRLMRNRMLRSRRARSSWSGC